MKISFNNKMRIIHNNSLKIKELIVSMQKMIHN